METMKNEAILRMQLLGVPEQDIEGFVSECLIPIVEVKQIENSDYMVRKVAPTKRVMEMLQKLEKERNILVYYMICDQGIWPDGEPFERISMLHVDEYESDYPLVKEECIGRCKTVPAYVYNADEDFIELAEIAFENVDGLLVQLS